MIGISRDVGSHAKLQMALPFLIQVFFSLKPYSLVRALLLNFGEFMLLLYGEIMAQRSHCSACK